MGREGRQGDTEGDRGQRGLGGDSAIQRDTGGHRGI